LIFNDDALYAIANLALKRKTGARALRSILDEIMLDIMYEIPSNNNIKSCIITKDVVVKNSKPDLKFYKKSA
jgi:ATP-dependent Clp protease ATP-binding subunit ClpX